MFDQLRPALLPTAEVRRRSDGTVGIYDPVSGASYEASADQANLVQLFDGQRSLLEVSAEALSRFGFVPFSALDDVVRGLADTRLLVDPPESHQDPLMAGGPWFDLFLPETRAAWRTALPTALRALELLLWPALAVAAVLAVPRAPLGAVDVLLFYVGASAALTLRSRTKAAVCAVAGAAPRRAQLVSTAGVLHVGPDTGVAVLLDRGSRALAHLGGLWGVASAAVLAWPWPGAFAGALVVAVLDLCPVVHSSASGMLAALSGEANLRERVRAWVGLPLFKRLLGGRLPRAERAMVASALLTMAWGLLVLYVVLGLGLAAGLDLIDVGMKSEGAWKAVAWIGAAALIATCPLPVVVLLGQLIEGAFALLWPREGQGKRSRGSPDVGVFRAIPLFSRLDREALAAIAAEARLVSYDAGEVIVEEGKVGDTFYSVRYGSAEVTQGEDGGGRVLARLGPGDCFGETAMLKDGVRTATVRSLGQTDVIELPLAAFEKVVAKVGGVDFAQVLRAASAIGKSKLFKGLPSDRLSSLATKFVPRSVPVGTDVVRFGEQGQEFYLVARGQVDVLSAEGKRLTTLGDGDHFGEIALLRNVPRTATVRTLSETLLLVLSRDAFLRALDADLSLSERAQAIATERQGRTSPPEAAAPPAS